MTKLEAQQISNALNVLLVHSAEAERATAGVISAAKNALEALAAHELDDAVAHATIDASYRFRVLTAFWNSMACSLDELNTLLQIGGTQLTNAE